MLDQTDRNNQVDEKISLSKPQMEAVEHKSGPLLVAAGAGSGKTRTLTQRLIYLIKNGVEPKKIVAITFTNKAANEMKSRILGEVSKMGKVPKSKVPFIGTFHSLGAKILRENAKFAGRSKSFVIFDDADTKRVAKKVLFSIDMPEKFTPAKLQKEFSRIKNNLLDTNDLDTETRRAFELYENELMKQNAFDFDDLLEKVVRMFREQKEIMEKYQKKFAHILVDEYQDINTSQYVFLKQLGGKHRNLTVVGDDQQSIYGFRWSDFTNFLNFERDWPDAKIVKLGQNYRSSGNIVRAAAGVIEKNKLQRPKKLWTENESGEFVRVLAAGSQEEEADFIVQNILRGKSAEKDVAVLYRTNAQSRALEEALNFNSVPYEIFGGVKFYERKEIKDIVACLRYALNPKDEISRERIEKTFRKKQREELIENLPRLGRELDVLELIGFVLKTTDYFEYLGAKFKNAEERTENVGELIRFASTFSSLSEFVERVALLQATDKIDGESPDFTVRLMTIHLAKGLEFDDVYIAGVSEGLLPHQKSLFSEEDLEEERRLAYVAMTRAKKRLFLSFYGFASRFLYEIPPEIIEFQNMNNMEGEAEIIID